MRSEKSIVLAGVNTGAAVLCGNFPNSISPDFENRIQPSKYASTSEVNWRSVLACWRIGEIQVWFASEIRALAVAAAVVESGPPTASSVSPAP